MPKGIEYGTIAEHVTSFRIPSRTVRLKLALTVGCMFLVLLYSVTTTVPFTIYDENNGTGMSHWEAALITQDDEQQHFNYNGSSYFVNTAGCRMPSLPIVDEQIRKYMEKVEPLNCTPAVIRSDSSSLWFQLTEEDIGRHYGVANASLIKCCYRAFERKSNNEVKGIGQVVCFRYGERVNISNEFVVVYCSHPDKTRESTFYKDYFAFVPLKVEVEERCEKAGNELKQRLDGEEEKLSVMILGIDSVSRLNFHRQMPLTTEVVVERLGGVELFGYNKVGDNTYPNLVPVLTGLNIDELNAVCHPYGNNTFDSCPFIWRTFAQAGYRTFYTEDFSDFETFNYFRKGFQNQPTDYYLRNFFRQAERHIGYNKRVNANLCLGGRSPAQMLADYAKKVAATMKTRLSFSLLWACAVTHDQLNNPSLIDETYSDLLEHMEREGFLNTTAVMLLSDHGMRFGDYRNTYQGMMEERQPFLFLLLPKWFQQKYSAAYHNLRKNRLQLTSHFDLHETLNDLIDLATVSSSAIKQRSLELLETNPIPRGISLFLPITPSRTCKEAGIAPHWCTCHDHIRHPINDIRVTIAAQYAVRSLNDMLKQHPQCSVLYLHSVVDATLSSSSKISKQLDDDPSSSDIAVRFVTKPGDAQFEATIRIDSRNRRFSLTGPVSRTNLYGKQSLCVDDLRIKLYCFCSA